MMRWLFGVVAALGMLVTTAGAEQYWITYEGNDFPENEGWERVFCDPNGVVGQGGAIRTFQDGALVLDSRESTMIVDFYDWSRAVDPEPGETFIMRWQVRIDDVPSTYPYDPAVGVFSDEFRAVGFLLGEDGLKSVFEEGVQVSYAPGVFHLFELRSPDMLSYSLWMDGEFQLTGTFFGVFESSRATWGDGVQGASSLARWDFVEFGVVPEPNTLGIMLVGTILFRTCQANRR